MSFTILKMNSCRGNHLCILFALIARHLRVALRWTIWPHDHSAQDTDELGGRQDTHAGDIMSMWQHEIVLNKVTQEYRVVRTCPVSSHMTLSMPRLWASHCMDTTPRCLSVRSPVGLAKCCCLSILACSQSTNESDAPAIM